MSLEDVVRPGAARQAFGGILHLPDAFLRYPEAYFLIYNRVTSQGQAGGMRGERLQEKTFAVFDAVYEEVERQIAQVDGPASWLPVGMVDGVEPGKMSAGRPALLRCFEIALRESLARQKPIIVVAGDLSRIIRSEAFHGRWNPEAKVMPEEFAQLRSMIPPGVVLATLEHPSLSEGERRSKSTRRTTRCGRPSEMDDDLRLTILRRFHFRTPSGRWCPSQNMVAKRLIEEVPAFVGMKVTAVKQAVHRVLMEPVPEWFALQSGCKPGIRWGDFDPPGPMFRVYLQLKQCGYGDPAKGGDREGETGANRALRNKT